MALRLASPGINIREVDLTRGSVNATSSLSAGIAAPFEKGPVEEVTEIRNENQLFETFGRPSKNDFHYEYWYSAANFLSYGGSLKVVRADSSNLKNSNAGVGEASSSTLKIKNFENYQEGSTGYYWAAKTPGSWSESVRVCVIDNLADQTFSGLSTSLITVGAAITQTVSSDESLRGIVTGVGSSEFYVKVVGKVNTSTGTAVTTSQEYTERGKYSFKTGSDFYINGSLGAGTTSVSVSRAGLGTESASTIGAGRSFTLLNEIGTTTLQLAGGDTFTVSDSEAIVASSSGISVNNVILIGTELFRVNNVLGNNLSVRDSGGVSFNGYGTTQTEHLDGDTVTIFELQASAVEITEEVSSTDTTLKLNTIGDVTANDYLILQDESNAAVYGEILKVDTVSNTGVLTPNTIEDWYNTQSLLSTADGDSTNILWRDVAPKPRTNDYVSSRNGGNDSFHLVVVDNLKGSNNNNNVTQERLETFLNLSKATDARISPSQKIYYKEYLELNSEYIYAGSVLGATDTFWKVNPVASNFSSGNTPISTSLGLWGQEASGVFFNSIGNKSFTLTGGKDYSGTNNVGGFSVGVADIESAYNELSNENEVELNFLLQGGASGTTEDEQRKANYIINIAQNRKDCVAFISPNRSSVVTPTTQAQKLEKILEFFTPLISSSYAIFDSGYQYVFDRFNNEFVYMPCSGDIAGLCVRTDIDQFPWFSPAGKVRGTLNNVIKLAYNPNQSDRDSLYSNRINPVITSPGSGTILFGDKTALSFSSAFDRINVRRLFITIEQAIRSAADAQLFEFNDSSTRANFINIVDPYLRDVQAKRGITDFLLICDESNNTPAVIDRNEFIADIYVKPARSINFIGLTFVATRTGVSFQTVAGTV